MMENQSPQIPIQTNLTANDHIKNNYERILQNISNVDHKVDIMAVTKTVAPEKINYACSLGINLLGENRVQEYLSKKDSYNPNAQVHFIGHLQTNKVKYIIDSVKMIHSVDSLKLAKEINRLAKAHGKTMDILLEINIGGETSKSGVMADGLNQLIDEILPLENVNIRGFMAIPPVGCNEKIFGQMQEHFERFKNYDRLNLDTLSMGMSQDYTTAIKYGATVIRIGTALFGQRDYSKGGI